MLFDMQNYPAFLAVLAALYAAASIWLQNNVGGKGRFRAIQAEMREIQLKIGEAAKRKDNKEMDALFSRNMSLTTEMMKLQFAFLIPLLAALLALAAFFPLVEPGTQDDVRLPLYDDGLPSHCDTAAMDGIFSNCYQLPQGAQKGAWVIDAFLLSPTNETLARNATAIYVEGGKPADIWLQSHTQSGLLDALMGKVPHTLSITTDKQNYALGEKVAIRASPLPAGGSSRVEAVLNSGTFFYVDLPFPLPLLNISRIIGSYGVFLLLAFLLGIAHSIGNSAYHMLRKTKDAAG
jgi:hypothetical protein